MTMTIKEALAELDPADDDHWTNDGMPRMDVLAELTGNAALTRKDVTEADPSFTRQAQNPAVMADDTPDMPDEPEEEDGMDDMEWIQQAKNGDIFKSEDTLLRAQNGISDLVNDLTRKMEEAKERIAATGRLQVRITKMLDQVAKNKPASETDPIQRYLAQQARVREKRAARAKKFTEQGIDADALANDISGKTPIDRALGQRKAAPGTTRPDPRMPVRGTRQAG